MLRIAKVLAVVGLVGGLSFGLVACGEPSVQEYTLKGRTITSADELRTAFGDPAKIDKMGPGERWTYKASDGEVVFYIAAGTVTLQTSSE